MLYLRNITLLLLFLLPAMLSAQTVARDTYIKRFEKIAISEMERTGIPASIKLAQGILESGDGKSSLARKANNHFGIKCHNDWKGKGYYLEDDDYDDNGKIIKSCFRVYKNPNSSYIAHSEFLRDPKKRFRYGFLFNIPVKDYRSWARGLKEAGYATSPTYAEKLIRIIETSELYRYDQMSSIDIPGEKPNLEFERLGIKQINAVKLVIAKTGETPVDIAERTNTSVSRIVKYNEHITNKNQKLKKDSRVYLQKKRKNFRGRKKWHYVKPGETMFDISQLYGLRLKRLYEKNRLPQGTQPVVGEKIKIRGWFKVARKKAPKALSKSNMDDEFVDNEDFVEDEDNIIIEIPDSNADDEEFSEDIVPETPESEIFDEPVVDQPEETEGDKPNTTKPENGLGNQGNNSGNNPAGDPETSEQPTTGVFYTVVKGDTLFSISKKYGTTVEGIKRLNTLTSNTISIGQKLRIF